MDRLRNLGFMLKDVSRLNSLNFERHAAELGLTITQCKVLAHLQRNQGVTQVRLSELTDLDQMTLVRVLDRMEQDGWVSRSPHPSDRRARCLNVTDAATPFLQQMWRVADRARAAALADLSEREAGTLLDLLERVQATLRELTAADATDAVPRIATRRTRRRSKLPDSQVSTPRAPSSPPPKRGRKLKS